LFNKLRISRPAIGIAFLATLLDFRFCRVFFLPPASIFPIVAVPPSCVLGLSLTIRWIGLLCFILGCVTGGSAFKAIISKPVCRNSIRLPELARQWLVLAALAASLACADRKTTLADRVIARLLWLHFGWRLAFSALPANPRIHLPPPLSMIGLFAFLADPASLRKLTKRLSASAATTDFRVFPWGLISSHFRNPFVVARVAGIIAA
jgi:hypothetical protein